MLCFRCGIEQAFSQYVKTLDYFCTTIIEMYCCCTDCCVTSFLFLLGIQVAGGILVQHERANATFLHTP